MKIQKEYTEDHQVKITAELASNILQEYKQRAARKLSKKTKIPGFRPGKAPYNVILNQIGDSAIYQEAMEILLDEEYPKIIEKAEIKPYSSGILESIESEDPPILHFLIPLEAEVELDGITNLRKEYNPEPLKEDEIDNYILNIRRNSASVVPLEQPAKEGNVVFITLSASSKENPQELLLENLPQQVLITTKEEEKDTDWPFKGFARKLIGRSEGEQFSVTKKFTESSLDERFKSKTVVFSISVQSVKGLELPKIDQEFLSNFGNYESIEKFKEDIREHLEKDKLSKYDDAYFMELVNELRDHSKIKYSPQMLDDEVNTVLERVESDLQRQHLDLETYLKIKKIDKEEFINKDVKPTAVNRLERSLIMKAFSENQKLSIDPEKLKLSTNEVLSEIMHDGSFSEIQKEIGNEKLNRAITIEAINRQMEAEIRTKLREIADIKYSKNSNNDKVSQEDNSSERTAKQKDLTSDLIEPTESDQSSK